MEKDDLYILGLIPARGGSVRIPLKNVKLLNGIPLIAYMIRSAAESRLLSRTIISTDHPEIKSASLAYGGDVPFDRPKEVSWDCPSEYVIHHAVQFVENEIGRKVDIVVLMQPTTPFCLPEDIDRTIEMLIANPQWDSTFAAMSIHQRPEWMYSVADDKTGSIFMEGEMKGDRGVMQNLPDMVMPNGACYAVRRQAIMEHDTIIAQKTGVYIMPQERCVDIDEPIDFEYAEFMARRLAATDKDYCPAARYRKES